MFENIINGLGAGLLALMDWQVLLFMFIGIMLGVVLGIIPGIGGLFGTALMVPFVFTMPPIFILPLMLSLDAVSYTGGSITAILLNIPGTGPNAATLIDGYPLAQKGQASRAIGAALGASAFGGVASVPMAIVMIPMIMPLVLRFRAPEMFFLIVAGLSFLAILARGSVGKGLISAGLGLLISFVGFQQLTGVPRLTFGILYLYEGIDIIPLVLGLFALTELLDLIMKGSSQAQAVPKTSAKLSEVWEGVKDVLRHKGLWLRSTIIGYIIGVVPGIGGEAAIFVAYAQAKQTCKNPETFGTGRIEGVIAPESANNAKEAGALLTTVAFGIPGSAVMAIMIAAFLLAGITPGPVMLIQNLDLVFSMLLTLVIANVVAAVVCALWAPSLIKMTSVRPLFLVATILPVVYVGAFAQDELMLNVILALIFCVLGVCMKKFGYSRPALLLGFVLGSLFEYYFFHAYHAFGPLFFLSPIPIILILLTAFVLSIDAIRPLFNRLFKGGARSAS